MLQAEVRHAEDGEVMDLPLGKQRRREDGQQYLHEREEVRVLHRPQIDESLDRTLSDALPEFNVFRANLLFTGMSRPFDSKCSELLHSDFDRAIDAVRGVERYPQAGYGGEICRADGPPSQSLQTLVGGEKLTGQELALRPVQSQRKPQAMVRLPVLLGEQGFSRGQMNQCRFVSGARPCAASRDQIQLGDLQPLCVGRDERHAAIELVHDLKDSFLQLVGRRRGNYQPPYPEVGICSRILWDQRISCFLHPIMEKQVGVTRAEN